MITHNNIHATSNSDLNKPVCPKKHSRLVGRITRGGVYASNVDPSQGYLPTGRRGCAMEGRRGRKAERMRLGTWNVSSVKSKKEKRAGELTILEDVRRKGLKIVGLVDTRVKGSG